MRFHHYLWHSARNGWLRFDETERTAYRRLGYEPPRPAVSEDGQVLLDNNSGEDFLFMHRRMIEQVNKRLSRLADPQYPRVKGWKQIPPPDDPDYPVPPPFPDGSDAEIKSDAAYHNWFVPRERRFKDPDFLRSVSLGELGARIEFSVHNRMHGRWSEPVEDTRPDADPRDPAAIDPRWDDVSYDWLGDFYSSHVHSTFWKLHGWVDDRIDDWAEANSVSGADSLARYLGGAAARPRSRAAPRAGTRRTPPRRRAGADGPRLRAPAPRREDSGRLRSRFAADGAG